MKDNRIKKYFWAIAILSIVAAVPRFLSYGLIISYIISTLTSVGTIFTLYKVASYFLEIFNKHIQDTEEYYNKIEEKLVLQISNVTESLKIMENRMNKSMEDSFDKVQHNVLDELNSRMTALSEMLKTTGEAMSSRIEVKTNELGKLAAESNEQLSSRMTALSELLKTTGEAMSSRIEVKTNELGKLAAENNEQLSSRIQSLFEMVKTTGETISGKVNKFDYNMYEILDELKKIDTAISLLKKPSTSNIAGKENPNRVETIVDKDTNYTLKNTYINNLLKKSDMLNGVKTVYTIEYDNEGKIEKCTNYDSNQNIQTETYYYKNGQVKQRKEYNKGKIYVSDFSENGKKIN